MTAQLPGTLTAMDIARVIVEHRVIAVYEKGTLDVEWACRGCGESRPASSVRAFEFEAQHQAEMIAQRLG